jgi:glucokinase
MRNSLQDQTIHRKILNYNKYCERIPIVGRVYLGVDLGGSNCTAALISATGKIIELEKIETRAQLGPGKVIQRVIQVSKTVLDKAKIKNSQLSGIGIGVPGVLDIKQGVVKYSPNLPGWKNIQLRKQLVAALRKPVNMDNDANMAAFGEKWQGAGKGFEHVVVYTLGTGVGGGIIQDGKIAHGSCDGAGELGHTTIITNGPRCGCGNYGCLEALASGTAIAREGRKAIRSNPQSRLAKLVNGSKQPMTTKLVFQAAHAGDRVAEGIIKQAGTYLGIGVANIINLLNPQIVIIGGGVSQGGEALLKYVRAEAKKRALKDLYKCTKIVRAQLADRAGVIGAAGVVALRKS